MKAQKQHTTEWSYDLLRGIAINALKAWLDRYGYYWVEIKGVLSAVIDEARREELIDYMAKWQRIAEKY